MSARLVSGSAAVVAAACVLLTGCSSTATDPVTPTPSPTTTAIGQVAVTASSTSVGDECNVAPYIVNVGPVAMTVTATGRVPISVSVFAPDKGAFTKRLARVRILRSGETKGISLRLELGAYEIACEVSGRGTRKRLTVV